MNRDDIVMVFVAVCCIGAAGVSATTLDATLSEDPEDVIELRYDRLPLGQEETSEANREAAANRDSREREGAGGRAPAPRASALDPVSSLQDGLWALLGLLVSLAAVALAYRYRDRLVALALALRSWHAGGTESAAAPAARQWPAEPPDDEVHRAWLSMVRQLDVPRPGSRTPLECARAAVEAGMDPDAVETLTRTFEEVRYGDRPVTEDRRERAREGLRKLRGEGP